MRAGRGHWIGVEAAASRGNVATFALSGLAVLVVLGVAGVILVARTGTSEAVRNAKDLARLAGDGIVQPNLTNGVLQDQPLSVAHLDHIVRTRVLHDPVVRVKIWTAAGRIIYSDQHDLIGSTYPLGEDESAALRADRTAAAVSDLNRPENRFERRYHKLFEVYFPVAGPDRTRLLFETYQRFSAISASSRRLLLALAPALVGALVILWLIQLPIAARLARRLREGQRDRETLLRRAIQSSDLERRRVASDLHDGAVQNLSGIAWSLSAAAADAPPALAESLHESAHETRRTIQELRSLLVELYPPDLHRTGIEAALGDLLAASASRGIDARLDVPGDLSLPPRAEALILRVAQEALRNVAGHSDASNVSVEVRTDGRNATVSVSDDGRGFVPEAAAGGSHFGLRMLRDLAGDAGGTLEVSSAPDAGTTIRLAVPLK
jgi:two-component system, NarL family, sensor kinase